MMTRTERLFQLTAKHRGGWKALSEARRQHHDVQDRFSLFRTRAFYGTALAGINPFPARSAGDVPALQHIRDVFAHA